MSQLFPVRRRNNVAVVSGSQSVFGLTFDNTDVVQTAKVICTPLLRRNGSACVYVTPNIQHIAEMRGNAELRLALQSADLVTADGFPLVRYAQMQGCDIPGRVTGREVVDEIIHRTPLAGHTLFFLIDSVETGAAVREWAAQRGLAHKVKVEVAPARFGENLSECADLADRIRACGTTLLFLGLGAPKCELFATRFKAQLGSCWALCIGQSVRVSLGLVDTPPQRVVDLQLEWAWRIVKEPRRLIRRYVTSAIGFAMSIAQDQYARAFGNEAGSVVTPRRRIAQRAVVSVPVEAPDSLWQLPGLGGERSGGHDAPSRAIPLPLGHSQSRRHDDYLIDRSPRTEETQVVLQFPARGRFRKEAAERSDAAADGAGEIDPSSAVL